MSPATQIESVYVEFAFFKFFLGKDSQKKKIFLGKELIFFFKKKKSRPGGPAPTRAYAGLGDARRAGS